MIELRGVGIVLEEFEENPIEIKLIIELKNDVKKIERMPSLKYIKLNNNKILTFDLYPFELIAELKVLKMLEIANNPKILIE